MPSFTKIAALALALGSASVQGQSDLLAAVLADTEKYSTLATAATAANLTSAIEATAGTLFAPDNDAFAAIESTVSLLLLPNNLDLLQAVLKFHLLATPVGADAFVALADGTPIETVFGDGLFKNGTAGLKDATTVAAEVTGPSNTALENGAFIHTIDKVLIPPGVPPATVVDLAVGLELNTLVALVTKAELAAALSANGPFTVFAPAEAELAKLPAEATKDTVADILKYHVVSGYYSAADIIAAAPVELTTLQGGKVSVTVDGSTVKVNGVAVSTADIRALNGVVHAVAEVIPFKTNEAPTEASSATFTTPASVVIAASMIVALIM